MASVRPIKIYKTNFKSVVVNVFRYKIQELAIVW